MSGGFYFCQDSFSIVWIVSIVSGQVNYCPDSFIGCAFLNIILLFTYFNVPQEKITHFFYLSREIHPRASSGKFLRIERRYPENFRFLGFCVTLVKFQKGL